jgi:hypothetical protein
MDRLSRRTFLGRALLAGAGATLFKPHVALASVPVSSVTGGAADPDYDPGFIAGEILAMSNNALTILDGDDHVRQVRLSSLSHTWKSGTWDVLPLSVGDCTYVRGIPALDGSIDVDRLWVGIRSIATEVLSVALDSFVIGLPNGEEDTVLVTPSTQVETPSGTWGMGAAGSLTPGQAIQLIAFRDSLGGPLTATKVFLFVDEPAAGEESAVDSTTFFRFGTWYCCGGYPACGSGSDCLPGSGTCGVCRTDRHQTAYPRLSTTNCEKCGTLNCCKALPQRACGASASIVNPCNNKSVSVHIQDCIGSNGHSLGSGLQGSPLSRPGPHRLRLQRHWEYR